MNSPVGSQLKTWISGFKKRNSCRIFLGWYLIVATTILMLLNI